MNEPEATAFPPSEVDAAPDAPDAAPPIDAALAADTGSLDGGPAASDDAGCDAGCSPAEAGLTCVNGAPCQQSGLILQQIFCDAGMGCTLQCVCDESNLTYCEEGCP